MENLLIQPPTQIGDILNKSLIQDYHKFYIMSAFVKKSGLSKLERNLKLFKTRGGQIEAVVGVDHLGTSIQALEILLEIADKSFIYANKKRDKTFHPKIYIFEGDGKSRILIGSFNLTRGGLYTNYELGMLYELDLNDKDQKKLHDEFIIMFNNYSDTNKSCCKELTKNYLNKLIEHNLLLNEEKEFNSNLKCVKKDYEDELFGDEEFGTFPIPFTDQEQESRYNDIGLPPIIVSSDLTMEDRGDLVWKKTKLPPSDVLYTKTKNTNVTGGLRLTQSKYEHNGLLIDQTTYFRHVVFKDLDWKVIKKNPFVEIASTKFFIRLLGDKEEEYTLEIRHKPSGESDQGNYTTSLSWGKFGEKLKIKGDKLVDSEFYLYNPPKGKKNPFFIDIKKD